MIPVALSFFLKYSYPILFLWVFIEQLGAPIPSTPLIITAGTLTATRRMNLVFVLAAVLLASLLADALWYWLGKRFGGTVVKLLCRLSMESRTCIRRTENYFTKHGPAALLVAKFVPGLGAVAAPIAGETGMGYPRFLAYDAAGILLWALTSALIGRIFGDEIRRLPDAFNWLTRSGVVLFVLLLAGFLIWRAFRQRAFLREIRMARLDPHELKAMLDRDEPVYIVDLRGSSDAGSDRRTLPGALRIAPDELIDRAREIPRDRDVVLFCSCPNEATAARTALSVRRMGVERIRPLLGGFDEWKRLGFPLEDVPDEPSGGLLKAG